MTGFRDFLTRFRPVATPGRASPPAGIPADRTAALRAELAPPLALLEDAETAARDVRRQAAVAAAARRSEAENKAAEILAQARLQAHRTRERAAEETARASEREAAEMLADADRRATAVREAARTRTSDLADRAVALVLEDIAVDRPPSPTPKAES
ncbi:hypothetical protein E4N62_42975 [Streptomyces sp. MNU76]|uniref:hypothetical protein n=1 Tax=Streptomyces sp. MNU76 TaxID=2560026 RepID=UPI001E5C8FDE|nr:hypothetical protein [Streptomyces sp. MNU76]MCC9711394.1 hypothetical protein [Streptomyces sp. MNU76]